MIGREQHNNSAALYPDEIPNCLLIHIDLANRNLLQTFTAEEILNMTRTLNHFTHDMTKDQRPLTKPFCLYLKAYIDSAEDATDIFDYVRLTFL